MRAALWGVFLFLLCLSLLSEAKRQAGQEKREKPSPSPLPAKRPRNRSVLSSGELTTKQGHSCTWQTSGEGLVSLLVNCSTKTKDDEERYWCRYAGKPDLCQSYGVKSSQYWKQLVGKLKKRENACEGEKVLKAKTCKKAPAEAHMKLAERSADDKKGEKEGGKKKAAAGKSSDAAKVEKRKKKEREEEDEQERKKREERTGFDDDDDEGLVNDMEPVQSYCSEGWHSVCSFFLKFFEG